MRIFLLAIQKPIRFVAKYFVETFIRNSALRFLKKMKITGNGVFSKKSLDGTSTSDALLHFIFLRVYFYTWRSKGICSKYICSIYATDICSESIRVTFMQLMIVVWFENINTYCSLNKVCVITPWTEKLLFIIYNSIKAWKR